MDKADRNYIESVILQGERYTRAAYSVAETYGLTDVVERLSWALEFQVAALVKLGTREPNPDGTTGPQRVTSEGVELGPVEG